MKKIKLGLLPKIIIAIILGIGAGTISPDMPVRVFVTFNSLFSEFLGFLIPLIIVGLVTPAIADIGKGAGKLLVVTTLLAYGATIFSGFLSYGVSQTIFPSLISSNVQIEQISEAQGIKPFFTVSIPAPLNVMTSLVMAFTLGLGIANLNTQSLKDMFGEFRDIITKTIQVVVLPLLPIYIFGIFFNMTHSGEVFKVLTMFVKIIGVIFVMHIFLLLFQYAIAGIFAKKNPLRLLSRMMPAYFTALGTQSSAATIPVTLRQTILNGVNKDIAGFVIPLCATIHLSGSTMKIVACAIALMMMQGIGYDFQSIAGFIFMLGITMVAAPGVPGGAIMAALGILSSMLGFDDKSLALMIALYIAMDSFGTACNVTGDGALALIIDKFFGKKE
ncbi:putative uncharacterized protein [Bacteroides sp. CAG:530]|nr:putative uncharacterized protein [Bacteroides sp. CAG:530]